MNSILSITIPTYNRANILIENLESILPELLENQIPVYICDDSTDNSTKQVIVEFQKKYPYIYYHHNSPRLGHDLNCIKSLEYAQSGYTWYLGDGMQIRPGGLRRVLKILQENSYDFIIVNDINRPKIGLQTGVYKDPALILTNLAWHMTLSGSSIYHSRFLESLSERYYKFIGTNFVQLGIILDNLMSMTSGLFWLNEPWVGTNLKKISYWEKDIIEVFAKDWALFILSLPDIYPKSVKHIAIKEHSKKTEVLEWNSLRRLRQANILGIVQFFKYWRYLRLASGAPFWKIALLSLTPFSFSKRLMD
jgi:abequosyltransferase